MLKKILFTSFLFALTLSANSDTINQADCEYEFEQCMLKCEETNPNDNTICLEKCELNYDKCQMASIKEDTNVEESSESSLEQTN